MNGIEVVTLLISLLAVVVATVSLVRTRRIAEQQLELEHITAELSRKQLEIINAEEKALKIAHIDVELEGYGNEYKFVISNHGGVEANDVNFHIEGEDNPLIPNEYEQRIPIKSLKPGKSVKLIASFTLNSPREYNTFVRWLNPDGSQGKEEYYVSV